MKSATHSWPKATGQWQRIHVDFAGPFFGKNFLIVVDAFSKYPEVFDMHFKSSVATIEKLRQLFTCFGIPKILITDNGTQFASKEFARFKAANGIEHIEHVITPE